MRKTFLITPEKPANGKRPKVTTTDFDSKIGEPGYEDHAWLTVGELSLRIKRKDGWVIVRAFKLGEEDGEAIGQANFLEPSAFKKKAAQ